MAVCDNGLHHTVWLIPNWPDHPQKTTRDAERCPNWPDQPTQLRDVETLLLWCWVNTDNWFIWLQGSICSVSRSEKLHIFSELLIKLEID